MRQKIRDGKERKDIRKQEARYMDDKTTIQTRLTAAAFPMRLQVQSTYQAT